MKRITGAVIAILLYSAIVFYFGWVVSSWLETFFPINKWYFGIVWVLIAYGFLIGRINHSLRLFSIAGSYWMIIMEYGLILFPIGTILTWVQELTQMNGIPSLQRWKN